MLVGGGAVQGCRANSTAQVIPLLLSLLNLLLLLFLPEPLLCRGLRVVVVVGVLVMVVVVVLW